MAQCSIGGSVKFWNKPNTSDISVYRGGTIGGQGFMGIYNGKYHSLIMHHLIKDDLQNSRITKKRRDSIVMVFWIDSMLEFKASIDERNTERGKIMLEQLRSKPTKRMRFCKDFGIGEVIENNHKFRKGQKFNVRLLEKEEYVKNENQNEMKLYMTDKDGKDIILIQGRHYDTRFINMLRFGFNGYKLEGEVESVSHNYPDLKINIIEPII